MGQAGHRDSRAQIGAQENARSPWFVRREGSLEPSCTLQPEEGGLQGQVYPGLGHVLLLMTPRTAACPVPLSMEFFRQEYWSGLPLAALGGLPDPAIKPTSLVSLGWQADFLPLSHLGSPIDFLSYTRKVSHS